MLDNVEAIKNKSCLIGNKGFRSLCKQFCDKMQLFHMIFLMMDRLLFIIELMGLFSNLNIQNKLYNIHRDVIHYKYYRATKTCDFFIISR